MDWLVYFHVLSIVVWIGGVAFVTAIVFPTLGSMEDSMAKVNFFMGFERRFQFLAKICVVIAGASGVLLFWQRGAFAALTSDEAFLLGYKFVIWLTFVVLLFGAEQRFMKILISEKTAPEKALRRLSIFHWVVLILSLIAIVFGIRLVRG
ncbi:MAG: hypothetical protein GTN74_04490 [Proteobacteria bacterium]|nr:hypothetical protein [Pseudomonadota bacterium]NIS68621.1 hypothetical protein [Pseudomonadota bacterium]